MVDVAHGASDPLAARDFGTANVRHTMEKKIEKSLNETEPDATTLPNATNFIENLRESREKDTHNRFAEK